MNKYVLALILILLAVAALGGWATYKVVTENRITPNDKFFVVSIAPAPDISADLWSLTVDGLVNHSFSLSYSDITHMPAVNETDTLKCVDGPTGTAVWTGVRIRDVLDKAGLAPGAVEVIFYGTDGYTSSLPLDYATRDDVLLAWGMNHVPLPRDQGFPLRVVAPGKYGYKWVKFVERVEVVNHTYEGYWESRGWSNSADSSTVSGWGLHAALLTLAAVLGGLAAVSGLKMSDSRNFWSDLPERFDKRFHNATSAAFAVVTYPTFLYWTYEVYRVKGSIVSTLHGFLAFVVLAFLTIGGAASLPLITSDADRARDAHRYALLFAYLLMLLTIVTGLMRI